MIHDKILTIENLKKRGWYLVNKCYLYNKEEETIMHLFFQCPYAQEVWNFFLEMLKVEWVFPASVKMFVEGWCLCPYSHNIILDLWGQVPLFLTWGLWKERNNRVFRDAAKSSKELCMVIRR